MQSWTWETGISQKNCGKCQLNREAFCERI